MSRGFDFGVLGVSLVSRAIKRMVHEVNGLRLLGLLDIGRYRMALLLLSTDVDGGDLRAGMSELC